MQGLWSKVLKDCSVDSAGRIYAWHPLVHLRGTTGAAFAERVCRIPFFFIIHFPLAFPICRHDAQNDDR